MKSSMGKWSFLPYTNAGTWRLACLLFALCSIPLGASFFMQHRDEEVCEMEDASLLRSTIVLDKDGMPDDVSLEQHGDFFSWNGINPVTESSEEDAVNTEEVILSDSGMDSDSALRRKAAVLDALGLPNPPDRATTLPRKAIYVLTYSVVVFLIGCISFFMWLVQTLIRPHAKTMVMEPLLRGPDRKSTFIVGDIFVMVGALLCLLIGMEAFYRMMNLELPPLVWLFITLGVSQGGAVILAKLVSCRRNAFLKRSAEYAAAEGVVACTISDTTADMTGSTNSSTIVSISLEMPVDETGAHSQSAREGEVGSPSDTTPSVWSRDSMNTSSVPYGVLCEEPRANLVPGESTPRPCNGCGEGLVLEHVSAALDELECVTSKQSDSFFWQAWIGIRTWFRFLPVLLIVGFLGSLIVAYIEQLTGIHPKQQDIIGVLEEVQNTSWLLLLVGFYVVVGAGVLEEWMVRGVVYGALRKHLPVLYGMLLSGLLFGILHGYGVQLFYTATLGFMLAYLREKTGGLVAPMFLHMTNNAIVMGMVFLTV